MKFHIFTIAGGVDEILAELQKGWAKDVGTLPRAVENGDIVFLLGHSGPDFFQALMRVLIGGVLNLRGTTVILLMCGKGAGGASGQAAEFIVAKFEAARVVYADKELMTIYIMEMPAGLGISKWDELLQKKGGDKWKAGGGASFNWLCFTKGSKLSSSSGENKGEPRS